ncbi:MAG: PEP-CTERM sorting domain-containing protein [Planctomycetia bacterium]|nr:PEP-CTERM sorting domain-containing protein [Planctomycetia bacterium]
MISSPLRWGLVASLALVFFAGTVCGAVDVKQGWDLLQTETGTAFGGVAFQGVPLGTFTFGALGTFPVGFADTIERRNDDAVVAATPGSFAISTELVALQLVSSVPSDFGLGVGFYYMTLQSVRGGPVSTGRMTISFADAAGGTFNSFFDVFFDIRLGALNGPIALSDQLRITNQGTAWNRIPPPGAVVIDGVNHFLDGADAASDFWPIGTFVEVFPTGATHAVRVATPEPSTLVLLAFGAVGFAAAATARRARSQPLV